MAEEREGKEKISDREIRFSLNFQGEWNSSAVWEINQAGLLQHGKSF